MSEDFEWGVFHAFMNKLRDTPEERTEMAEMRTKKLSLVKQVEKIQNDRTYLRSGIASLLAATKDVPGAIKPAIVEQLQKMLDYTEDQADG